MPIRNRCAIVFGIGTESDLSPRLKPNARKILTQTRWHEDDLAGRVIEEMKHGGDKWEIVSLPAEAEDNDLLGRKPGEWLWDDEYGYGDFLRHEKATQIPRNWSALYRQRPTPTPAITSRPNGSSHTRRRRLATR